MSFLLSHLLKKRTGIPVLMYHKVETTSPDSLTVSTADFENQLKWLKSAGYVSISLQNFLDVLYGKKNRADMPTLSVLITFDDGYLSTLKTAAPLLAKFNFKATLFATSSYVAGPDSSNFMSSNDLLAWQAAGHDLALHSHAHPNYRQIQNSEILEDLNLNRKWFSENNIQAIPVLAYPYGARPKEPARNTDLKTSFKKQGLLAAFRIGNKVVTWKSIVKKEVDPFEIPRIDIRGDDTLKAFSIKVQKGRIRPFQ